MHFRAWQRDNTFVVAWEFVMHYLGQITFNKLIKQTAKLKLDGSK